jgi:hypothetical protein
VVERRGGDVDDDRVVKRSATLDDSVPDCEPRPKRRDRSEEPVGVDSGINLQLDTEVEVRFVERERP